MATIKRDANGGEPVLTVKEAILEIRDDVKALNTLVNTKADKADIAVVAAQKANEAVTLYHERQIEDRKADRRWLVGIGVTATLTLVGTVASNLLRIWHP